MVSHRIEDFASYVNNIEFLPFIQGFSIFRGQAVRGNLLPGIARKDPERDTSTLEKDMLRQLALRGAALIADSTNETDLLVHAQHFGLKTRLLDWTSNPLVALWFACTSKQEGDTYVYALGTDGMLMDNAYSINPFEVGATKVFQPRLNNPRILAQHGWFTLHCFSPRDNRWVRLDAHEIASNNLMEIVIPADKREGMIGSLHRHGISAQTLFPDLSGLCQYLNWRNNLAPPNV